MRARFRQICSACVFGVGFSLGPRPYTISQGVLARNELVEALVERFLLGLRLPLLMFVAGPNIESYPTPKPTEQTFLCRRCNFRVCVSRTGRSFEVQAPQLDPKPQNLNPTTLSLEAYLDTPNYPLIHPRYHYQGP